MTSSEHPQVTKNQKWLAVLIYFLNLYIFIPIGFIISIIFFFVKKQNTFVRFHAAQSLLFFGILFLLDIGFYYIPVIGRVLNALLIIGYLIGWILLMIKAYQGVWYKLPYIGDLAEKLLKKIG